MENIIQPQQQKIKEMEQEYEANFVFLEDQLNWVINNAKQANFGFRSLGVLIKNLNEFCEISSKKGDNKGVYLKEKLEEFRKIAEEKKDIINDLQVNYLKSLNLGFLEN